MLKQSICHQHFRRFKTENHSSLNLPGPRVQGSGGISQSHRRRAGSGGKFRKVELQQFWIVSVFFCFVRHQEKLRHKIENGSYLKEERRLKVKQINILVFRKLEIEEFKKDKGFNKNKSTNCGKGTRLHGSMFIWRFNPVSPSNASVIGFKPAKKKTVCWAKISRIEEKWNSGKRKSLLCSNQTEQENREKTQRRKKKPHQSYDDNEFFAFPNLQYMSLQPPLPNSPQAPQKSTSFVVENRRITGETCSSSWRGGGAKNSGKWHKSWKIGKPFEIPLIHVASVRELSNPGKNNICWCAVPFRCWENSLHVMRDLDALRENSGKRMPAGGVVLFAFCFATLACVKIRWILERHLLMDFGVSQWGRVWFCQRVTIDKWWKFDVWKLKFSRLF